MTTKLQTIILAAGLGTRMKSERAKVLHELAGKPLITYPVDLALSLRSDLVVAVVGHQAYDVRSLLESRYSRKVRTAIQKQQLGTGHAVIAAEGALGGSGGLVVILSGDAPMLRRKTVARLISGVRRKKTVLGFLSFSPEDATGYGRVIRDDRGRIAAIVEHRDANAEERKIRESNSGIYVAEKRFLFENLKKIGSDNDQGEYYLPDLVRVAVALGHEVLCVESSEEECAGVNDHIQLAELEKRLRLTKCRELMAAGVTIRNPESTFIDQCVNVSPDTIIEANCRLKGKTRVGRNCLIEIGTVIDNSTIADGVRLKPYTIIEESKVRDGAILGPFAHLRPGSVIGSGCHVGNFVETKKTTLKPGAKANHLSYLGDAVIGKKSNVGAGTITCNYDGYNKFPTVVGDEVLIGSDTQLIAPIKIRDRVVLGAGTSLDGGVEVPKGALVVTRPAAVVVPGYRDRLEKRSKKAKGRKKK